MPKRISDFIEEMERLPMSRDFPLAVIAVAVVLSGFSQPARSQDRFAAPRMQMVKEHIASEGVTNPRVLEQMGKVPRHEFIRADLRNLAYYDLALDIGFKQTISPPFIVAYMTECLDPQPTDRVLEIGTGSGYQAAVLSDLVQDVYTIEIVEPLGRRSAALLDRLGYKNVHCKVGDGYQGWPEHAPFDKIIVTCSPEDIPKPLVEQLKEGGKMIIPLGERYQQVFHLLEKENGELKQTRLIPTLFVPMTGKMEELREKLPDPLRPQVVNGGFETGLDEQGLASGWHYQRRAELVDEAVEGNKSICFTNTEAGRTSHILQGFPLNGAKISQLTLRWSMKSAGIKEGRLPTDTPGIVIYFFNEQRHPIDKVSIGPWVTDSPEWKSHSHTFRVPPTAREAIIHAGLNGATGRLWLDDIRMEIER